MAQTRRCRRNPAPTLKGKVDKKVCVLQHAYIHIMKSNTVRWRHVDGDGDGDGIKEWLGVVLFFAERCNLLPKKGRTSATRQPQSRQS